MVPLTLATTLAMAKKTDPQGGEDEIRQGGQLVEADLDGGVPRCHPRGGRKIAPSGHPMPCMLAGRGSFCKEGG